MNRIGFASLLCLSVFALNLSASDGAAATTTEGSAGAGTVAASGTTKTVSVKDIEELRKRIAEQEKQIEQLQQSLVSQRDLLETTVRAVSATGITAQPETAQLVNTGGVVPKIMPAARAAQPSAPIETAPLSLKIGNTYITPVGFMDFTFVGRSTNLGSGIGTNFGSIPFNNNAAAHLNDDYLSVQNSRIGARFDALMGKTQILGYWESDFLGQAPTNILVSSNSASFRLRLFYVDLKRGGWEITGGQTWSLMTPNRHGISPLPGDVFFTQDVDTNYQVGLTWARQAGFRAVYHAGKGLHFGVSLEDPQQYIGGSSGGGAITIPGNLPAYIATQFDAGASTTSAPAVRPDIIAKMAVDFPFLHSELVGITSQTKTYQLPTATAPGISHSTTSGGVSFNNIITIAKRFNIVQSGSYGEGIGRYFFGQGPNVVVNSDGRPTNVKSAGGIVGAELNITKSTLLYGYWGQDFFGRSNVYDPSTKKLVGYGYPGSSSGNNRAIEEITGGLQQTLWKDPRYGGLSFFVQYSYLLRDPWYFSGTTPHQAHSNMVFLNLRYTLPGAPPKLQ
jgi:hypothetical protein